MKLTRGPQGNIYVPERAPTPNPATNLPIVICTIEYSVPVWTATPTVKIADHKRMDPRRPNLSEVKACARAPLHIVITIRLVDSPGWVVQINRTRMSYVRKIESHPTVRYVKMYVGPTQRIEEM